MGIKKDTPLLSARDYLDALGSWIDYAVAVTRENGGTLPDDEWVNVINPQILYVIDLAQEHDEAVFPKLVQACLECGRSKHTPDDIAGELVRLVADILSLSSYTHAPGLWAVDRSLHHCVNDASSDTSTARKLLAIESSGRVLAHRIDRGLPLQERAEGNPFGHLLTFINNNEQADPRGPAMAMLISLARQLVEKTRDCPEEAREQLVREVRNMSEALSFVHVSIFKKEGKEEPAGHYRDLLDTARELQKSFVAFYPKIIHTLSDTDSSYRKVAAEAATGRLQAAFKPRP